MSFELIEGKRFMTVRYQVVTRITDIMFYHSQLFNSASLYLSNIYILSIYNNLSDKVPLITFYFEITQVEDVCSSLH